MPIRQRRITQDALSASQNTLTAVEENRPVSYPAILRREKTGGYYLSFPDVPGANTAGAGRATTLKAAAACLAAALQRAMEQNREIPFPSKPKTREHLIAVPADVASKIADYQVMREGGRSHSGSMRRRFDPRQKSSRKTAQGETKMDSGIKRKTRSLR